MQKYYPDIRLFLYATGISFLGSLPLGTLNVATAGISINKGVYSAVLFASGVILIEMVMVRITLLAIRKIERPLFKLLNLLSSVIIITIAIFSLIAAFHMQPLSIPVIGEQLFLSGLLLSLLNPFHLPFWIGWTAVLKSKKILTDAYNVYVIAIGIGTALAFATYVLAGSFLIHLPGGLVNAVIGVILLVTGLVQLYKIVKLHWTI